MITINGRKMGKSYNNVIKLTELFSGSHPLLEQAYHPMTVRFFILQTHYRSTLDFGNEALQAAQKGMRRLWEAYEALGKLNGAGPIATDAELDAKCNRLVDEFDEFMNDDLNTAKVLASMFELVPVINGIKDKHIAADALSAATINKMLKALKAYLEDIFGLVNEQATAGGDNSKLDGVLQLLIDIRKDAKAKKDFATSDKIRNQLQDLGVIIKDEKDGSISVTFC
jgi:cysteinyl-tRNA synthetase